MHSLDYIISIQSVFIRTGVRLSNCINWLNLIDNKNT